MVFESEILGCGRVVFLLYEFGGELVSGVYYKLGFSEVGVVGGGSKGGRLSVGVSG